MTDDMRHEDSQSIGLPLTAEDLRRLTEGAAKDDTAQSVLARLESLPADRREGVIAVLDMLLVLRAIPPEHHAAVRVVLRFFNRLTDEQRAAYLRLADSATRE